MGREMPCKRPAPAHRVALSATAAAFEAGRCYSSFACGIFAAHVSAEPEVTSPEALRT